MKKLKKLLIIICIVLLSACKDTPKVEDKAPFEDVNKDYLLVDMNFDEEKGKYSLNNVDGNNLYIHYVFNEAKFQESRDPQRILESAVSNKALVFDGYSNYIELENSFEKEMKEITIDVFVSPRAFEWDDPNAIYNSNQKIQSIVSTLNTEDNTGFQVGMYKYGDFVFQIGVGNQIYEVWNEWNELDKYVWNHLTCVWNGETGNMAIYKNGEIINFIDNAYGTMSFTNKNLLIGKSYQPEHTGLFELHMFNGAMDELKIYDKEVKEEELVKYHESFYNKDGKITELKFEEVWLDENIVNDDYYHPQYHMTPPQHWMNEPHALFYYNGYYHLFYQFNPSGPYWRQICWGHWVSKDMVNWENVKEAIVMDENTSVRDGAWSGCASYKADGTPVLFITAGDDARNLNPYSNQNITIAVPKDLSDPYLTEWEVSKELVAEIDVNMGRSNEFRDPNIYYEDGTYYMIVGSGTNSYQGTAQVFTTKNDDFTNWEYKGHIMEPKVYEEYMGTTWELTNLVKLYNSSKTISKYLFAFSPAGSNADNDVFYYLGNFDKKTCKFIPEHDIPMRMDIGNNVFTGPTISTDPLTKRVLICSILQDQRSGKDHYDSGWAFMAGIPRELSLDDEGNLMVSPLKESYNLLDKRLYSNSNCNIAAVNECLSQLEDTQIYMKLNVSSIDASNFSLFMKETGRSNAKFNYNFDENFAYIDTENVPKNRVKGVFGDYVYGKGKDLNIEIFIDRAVVEIYINGHQTLSAMIYDLSPLMHIEADGEIKINNIEIYRVKSIR